MSWFTNTTDTMRKILVLDMTPILPAQIYVLMTEKDFQEHKLFDNKVYWFDTTATRMIGPYLNVPEAWEGYKAYYLAKHGQKISPLQIAPNNVVSLDDFRNGKPPRSW